MSNAETGISTTAEEGSIAPWILLIIVLAMVAFMAILVMFLWMRRKNIRLKKEIKNSNNHANNSGVDDKRRHTVTESAKSRSSITALDIEESQEDYNGMETGQQAGSVQEGC